MSKLIPVPPNDFDFVFDQTEAYYIFDALQKAVAVMAAGAATKGQTDRALESAHEAMEMISELMRKQM